MLRTEGENIFFKKKNVHSEIRLAEKNNMLKRHNVMGVGEGDEAPLTTKTQQTNTDKKMTFKSS